MSKSEHKDSQISTYLVILLSVVGSFSSLGNFIVNISGGGGFETSTLPFLGVPFAAFFLAALVIAFEWDMKRDKWPGRLRDLTIRLLPVAPLGIEDTPESLRAIIVVLYKEYYRMALSEGRKELAKDFEKEIKRWEKGK